MANPAVSNLDGSNPGPAGISTTNTQTLFSTAMTLQPIYVTMTPLAVAAASAVEQSFGVNGVSFVTATTSIKAGDIIVSVNPPADVPGVAVSYGRVDSSTAEKFYLKFVNPTAGSVTPPSGVWVINVMRPNNANTANPQSAILG